MGRMNEVQDRWTMLLGCEKIFFLIRIPEDVGSFSLRKLGLVRR